MPLKELLDKNREWAEKVRAEDPQFFKRLGRQVRLVVTKEDFVPSVIWQIFGVPIDGGRVENSCAVQSDILSLHLLPSEQNRRMWITINICVCVVFSVYCHPFFGFDSSRKPQHRTK